MNETIINISKEAGIIKMQIEAEKFDLKQIRQFLARVERLNFRSSVKKKSKERFERQMQKI